jgi:hypothetical protein
VAWTAVASLLPTRSVSEGFLLVTRSVSEGFRLTLPSLADASGEPPWSCSFPLGFSATCRKGNSVHLIRRSRGLCTATSPLLAVTPCQHAASDSIAVAVSAIIRTHGRRIPVRSCRLRFGQPLPIRQPTACRGNRHTIAT